MKRTIRRLISLLLVFALLLPTLPNVKAASTPGYHAIISTLNDQNWMSGISDERYLYEINLPGTHDSATSTVWNGTNNHIKVLGFEVFDTGAFAKCQDLTIAQQLRAGTRLLDLRFDANSAELYLCHGDKDNNKLVDEYRSMFTGLSLLIRATSFLDIVLSFIPVIGWLLRLLMPSITAAVASAQIDLCFYCYEGDHKVTMSSALDDVKTFLRENPTETVIFKPQVEQGDTNKGVQNLKKLLDALSVEINPSTNKPYLYTENGRNLYSALPQLKDCRGQIVFLSQNYAALGYGANFSVPHDDNGGVSIAGVSFHTENTWDVNKNGKWEKEQALFSKWAVDVPGDVTQHLSYGCANYSSSNCLSADERQSPKEIADFVNPKLKSALVPGKFYGWFLCDFVSSDLNQAIWKTNFPDNLPFCTITLDANGGKIQGNRFYTTSVQLGERFALDVKPTRADRCVFRGWYLDKEGTQAFSDGQPIRSDVTLYAKWDTGYESYLDEYGVMQEAQEVVYLSGGVNTLEDGWYAVKGTVGGSTLTVKGNVNLILCDGSELRNRSINVTYPNTLTIWAQSTEQKTMGKITRSDQNATEPLIGSAQNCGGIIINGGYFHISAKNIDATRPAPCIGTGGFYPSLGNAEENTSGFVIINGGIILATTNSPVVIGGTAKQKLELVWLRGGKITFVGRSGDAAAVSGISVLGIDHNDEYASKLSVSLQNCSGFTADSVMVGCKLKNMDAGSTAELTQALAYARKLEPLACDEHQLVKKDELALFHEKLVYSYYECAICGEKYINEAAKYSNLIEAWYDWSADNRTVTLHYQAAEARWLTYDETAAASSAVTLQPTCTEPGEITWSASFGVEGFPPVSKTVTGEAALGHQWSEPEYTWTEDNTAVIAKRTCSREGCGHVEEELSAATVTVTPDVSSGKTVFTYTASFTNSAFSAQTTSVEMERTDAGVSINGEASVNLGSGTASFTAAVTSEGEGGSWIWYSANEVVAAPDVEHPGRFLLCNAGEARITAEYSSDTSFGTASMVLTVDPITLNVSGIRALDKVYDGTTAAELDLANVVLEGLRSGDDVHLLATGSFADADVGDAKPVSLAANLEGMNAGNYVLGSVESVTAIISPRPVVVTAENQIIEQGEVIDDSTDAVALSNAVVGDRISSVTLSDTSVNPRASLFTSAASSDLGAGTLTPGSAVIRDAAGRDVTANYEIRYETGSLRVERALATLTTAPDSLVLTYNGTAQELVTAGVADGGTVQYSLDGVNFTDAIPTATAAGVYRVYYMVKGDAAHDDLLPQSTWSFITSVLSEDDVTIDREGSLVLADCILIPAKDGLKYTIAPKGTEPDWRQFSLPDGDLLPFLDLLPDTEYTVYARLAGAETPTASLDFRT